MSIVTVHISEEKKETLKVIAGIEKKDMKEIISALIDEYIDRYKETSELLSKPEWVDFIRKGKEEVVAGVKGKMLDELGN